MKTFAIRAAHLFVPFLVAGAVLGFAHERTNSDTSYDDSAIPEHVGELVTTDGKIYCYENGVPCTDGLRRVTNGGISKYYYFQEDGSAYTGGYMAIRDGDDRSFYYFQEDGTAFTDGYMQLNMNGGLYYFYFEEDGRAYTDGLKEVAIDGQLYYFYFLSNGQGYTDGYKTVEQDGKINYYYFEQDGKAVTDTLKVVLLNDKPELFYFKQNGAAFTGGYQEITYGDNTDYYFFLSNGQAFNAGYKMVTIDGVDYYFYFGKDGKAFKDGWKEIWFGEQSYEYFFQPDGRAKTNCWYTENGKDMFINANGRVCKNEFVKIDGKLYCFGEDKAIVKDGWFYSGNAYYYAKSDGTLAKNTVIDGYKLDSKGRCTTKYRIIKYVNKIIPKPKGMSDQDKIRAIYDWVFRSKWGYIRTYEHTRSSWVWKQSWIDDMASSIMDKKAGNCFRYACFLGLLIHEATGLPVTFYHGYCSSSRGLLPHGWITVKQNGKTYLYDVELDKFVYLRKSSYKRSYSSLKNKRYFKGVGTTVK